MRVGGKENGHRVGPVSSLSSRLPHAPEYVAMGISLGWTLVELTVDFCCPLGQARDLCVHSHTQADSLL